MEAFLDSIEFSDKIREILKENKIPHLDETEKGEDGKPIVNPSWEYIYKDLKKKSEEFKRSLRGQNIYKDAPVFNKDFSSFVILANTPFIEASKRDKFKEFLNKTITKDFKDMIKEFIFPYTDEEKDNYKIWIVLLKLETYEEAKNNKSIDKTRVAKAVNYLEYDKIINMQEDLEEFKPKPLIELIEWETNSLTEMVLIKTKTRLITGKIHYLKKEFVICSTIEINEGDKVKWSPQGRYIIVNTGDTIKIYGATEKETLDVWNTVKFNTEDFSFSNNEKYMLSFVGHTTGKTSKIETGTSERKENLYVWDMLKSEPIRGLSLTIDDDFQKVKFSNDSKYLARIKKDVIIVYESPLMTMLPDENGVKQPLKSDWIYDFCWHPKRNLLLTFNAKKDKKIDFSTIIVYEIPSRKRVFNTTLAGLEIVSYEFNKSGNLLAVLCKTCDKVPQFSVKILEMSTNEIGSTTENLKPDKTQNYYTYLLSWVDTTLVIAGKYKENNLDTVNVRFYRLKIEKNYFRLEAWGSDKSIKNYKASHLIASSNGIHFLLANIDRNNSNSYGKVELYALYDGNVTYCKSFEFGGNLSNITWDESGRIFCVEVIRNSSEAIKFYDCIGNPLYDFRDPDLSTVSWRPRHFPCLNNVAEEENIRKNFKEINKIYEEEDSKFLSKIDQEKRKERKKIKDAFMEIVEERRNHFDTLQGERDKIYKEPEEVIIEVEYLREEILSYEEVVIKSII